MKTNRKIASVVFVAFFVFIIGYSASRPEKTFTVFQFPQDQVPRIDGAFEDWDIVPESYAIGLDELKDTECGKGSDLDPSDFDLSVKVAWVSGLNRLYFYYEAQDDFWDFARPGLKNDIFEISVDGNLSGGPFIKTVNENQNRFSKSELHFMGHGAHAQNYHVFTPASQKAWAMVWGNTPWIKDFPHANAAQNYNFKHGESGTFKMEFYITVYDHADSRGPSFSTESNFVEDNQIGLSWCILEYDDEGKTFESFMNLAHDTEMIRNGSALCIFKLMPIEENLRPSIEAKWSFSQIGNDPRHFAFQDNSHGDITAWHWDFGDGSTSDHQHPMHHYKEAGEWVVTLTIKDSPSEDRLARVWDVVTP